ncbi:hypothetical protein [Anaeroselena agilis]|uniref:N-acetyltransferase domain-containing protein n=1 Tax=Anaeroselena agilis TaxID=3063788 RepID=A0ABU3P152_9FIRM|nr:hypothetical protein [Selenomonadales bacterium 4137-cl]
MMRDNSPGEPAAWSIDAFRPADAEGVVKLYYSIYGDQYPVKAVYDPAELIRQNGDGDAYRVVARTAAGEIVGHIALYRSTPPNRDLYEQGQLMVRQDYRATDIAAKLFVSATVDVPERYGMEQIWGEAVCNHLVTQQMTAKRGFYATAVEVALMPGESYAKAFSRPSEDAGRVAILAVFHTYKAKPQTIFLPEVYEETLRILYSAYPFGHNFVRSRQDLPEGVATRAKVDVFAGAGVARVTLLTAGQDFAAYIEKVQQQVVAEGAAVIQFFLPLSWPHVGAAVAALRGCGCFLGGFLPRWFDGDGLLMQRVLAEPNFAGINLYTKQAKGILDVVYKDWQAVTRSG